MLNRSILSLFSILFLTSCGNILVRSSPKDQIHLAKFEKPKSLTLRHGAKVDKNTYRRDFGIGYEPLSEHEVAELEKILGDTNNLQLRKTKALVHSEFKKEDVEVANQFLDKDSYDPESELQFNLYTTKRYGHPYILVPYMVWAAGHFVTLGILPLWMPQELNYFGDIRSSNGKVLYTFDKNCRADFWLWSPLLLAGYWERGHVAGDAFQKDCILSIFADAQKSDAL